VFAQNDVGDASDDTVPTANSTQKKKKVTTKTAMKTTTKQINTTATKQQQNRWQRRCTENRDW